MSGEQTKAGAEHGWHSQRSQCGVCLTLTLSASSGTRCCTRSSTYMLECSYELRRTQNRRGRRGLRLGHGG